MLITRDATSHDAKELAGHVLPADGRELAALGLTPSQALQRGLEAGRAIAVLWGDDGPLLGVYGIRNGGGFRAHVAAPWAILTTAAQAHRRPVARESRRIVNSWRALYTSLVNMVDCRNARAIAWLGWLGAKFGPPERYGRNGEMFLRFEFRGFYV